MSFSQVVLRIGTSLVSWLVLFAYGIWLSVVDTAGCTDVNELFALLLGAAPFAVGAAVAVRATRPFADIHRMLRWGLLPLAILLILSAPAVWDHLQQVTLDGAGFCTQQSQAAWEPWWAPVQVIAMVVVLVVLARDFLTAGKSLGNSEH